MTVMNEATPATEALAALLDPETRTYTYHELPKYNDSTYDIVSRVAYLIGVPRYIFENEAEPPKMEIHDTLETNKAARIIRYLCMVRAEIILNYGRISKLMKTDFRSIYTVPEYIPKQALDQLARDGINLNKKPGTKLRSYIVELNKLIRDRINNCKDIFPTWLNWDYIRELFNMPNGMTEAGVIAASNCFFSHLECYPYSIYINWNPWECGNLLYSDKKFVTLLYEQHSDSFGDMSKVSDASTYVKDSIYNFIDDASKLVMVVDCENTDPYRLSATLSGLGASYAAKILKIILVDDVNTVDAWRILASHINIPVEHIMTERVKQTKSLVDIQLTAAVCKEHYASNADSFIIVSSDSDYWGLITSLPNAHFLVMVERENCSFELRKALSDNNIFYCYIEDFYTGDGESLKKAVLFTELNKTLDAAISLNINEMMDAALATARIDMTPTVKKQFVDKHIRQMRLEIDEDGTVRLELKK